MKSVEMTIHESNALGHYLVEYPENKTFNEILELLENEKYECITVWEPFEYYPAKDVIQLIVEMKTQLESSYN